MTPITQLETERELLLELISRTTDKKEGRVLSKQLAELLAKIGARQTEEDLPF